MSKFYAVASLTPHPELDRLLPPQSPDEYEAMKADIAANRIFTPLIICRHGEAFTVLDGRHRLRAASELGMGEVPCTLLDALDEDAQIERGLLLNNRRNMTSEQKRELTKALLKKWPDKPNVLIARFSGFSDKTVGVIREELVATSEIPKFTKTVGADGKERPTTYKPRATGSIVGRKKNGNGARAPEESTDNEEDGVAVATASARSRLRTQDGETPEQAVRRAMAASDTKEGAAAVAGMHPQTYARIHRVVLLADDPNLRPEQAERARAAMQAINAGASVKDTYETVREIADAKFGDGNGGGVALDERHEKRLAKLETAIIGIVSACDALEYVDVPAGIPAEKRTRWLQDMEGAVNALREFKNRVKEA